MTEALYILLAFVVGFGSAFQVAMLGLTKVDPPGLASPFNKTCSYAIAGIVALVALVLASRGVPTYLAAVGFFGFTYVLASAFLGPRIGIALYISAVTAGTLIGGVGLDHYGAFGNQVIRIDALKLMGLTF